MNDIQMGREIFGGMQRDIADGLTPEVLNWEKGQALQAYITALEAVAEAARECLSDCAHWGEGGCNFCVHSAGWEHLCQALAELDGEK